MTPLMRFLTRFLPGPAARLVLSLIYAGLIIGVLVTLASTPPNVLYVNVPDLQLETGGPAMR